MLFAFTTPVDAESDTALLVLAEADNPSLLLTLDMSGVINSPEVMESATLLRAKALTMGLGFRDERLRTPESSAMLDSPTC